jgi:simple sugar transport system permease protein
MEQIFNLTFLAGLLGAMIRMATPIIFGTMGEIITERSGVLNLGIEGIMLMGAMTGFLTTLHTGSLWLGVLAAAVVGILLSLLMAFLSVILGLSQQVSVSPPTVKPFSPLAIPLLSTLPVVGKAFFNQYSLVYIAFLLIPIIWVLLFKTSWGLVIRTVGENPLAADTVGINVNLVRTLCLAAGGALMGIGGAFLTLAHQNMFLIEVVGGRGWVCIAMVIFGNWNPIKGAGGALLFGLLDGLQLRLQGIWYKIPFHLFLVIPYLITIIALATMSRKTAAPAGLLKPYRREEKG